MVLHFETYFPVQVYSTGLDTIADCEIFLLICNTHSALAAMRKVN